MRITRNAHLRPRLDWSLVLIYALILIAVPLLFLLLFNVVLQLGVLQGSELLTKGDSLDRYAKLGTSSSSVAGLVAGLGFLSVGLGFIVQTQRYYFDLIKHAWENFEYENDLTGYPRVAYLLGSTISTLNTVRLRRLSLTYISPMTFEKAFSAFSIDRRDGMIKEILQNESLST